MRFVKGHVPWNTGLSSWNAGLTKEMDSRVMEHAEKIKGHPYFGPKKFSLATRKKISLAAKNRRYSEEAKKSFSLSQKNRWKSPDYRRKQSKALSDSWARNPARGKKQAEKTRKRWTNPIYREQVVRAWAKSIRMKPNKKEQILINLFKENGLPYKFVGDGKVIIDGKIPDFINVNGEKRIVELFGDYWHNLPIAKERDKRKAASYKKFGYKTLIIWEHELKDLDSVLEKILLFEPCAGGG